MTLRGCNYPTKVWSTTTIKEIVADATRFHNTTGPTAASRPATEPYVMVRRNSGGQQRRGYRCHAYADHMQGRNEFPDARV